MKAYITMAAALAALTLNLPAQADDAATGSRFYGGIGLGISGFELRAAATPAVRTDLRSQSLKAYLGYEVTRYFGLEAGYVRTGEVSETRIVDGQTVTQTAKSRAVYSAATGRFDVTPRFTVTGRLGLAYGDVNGDDPIGGAESLFGHRTSLMGGFGTRYRVNDGMSVALDIDYIGRESRRVEAGIVTVTARKSF